MESEKILQSFGVKDTLNSEIWDYDNSKNDKEPNLKPEIAEKLLEIADDFISFLGVDVDIERSTLLNRSVLYSK